MGILYHKDRSEMDRFLKKYINPEVLNEGDGNDPEGDLVSKIDKTIEKDNVELAKKKQKKREEETKNYEV